MKTRAAVLRRVGQPLEVLDLEVEQPQAGEVLVRMGASSVCHSDLLVAGGVLPSSLPMVMGHEGAGTVAEVGQGVQQVRKGDRVVLSWLPQCGHCFYCRREQPSLCESGTASMMRATMSDGTPRYRRNGEAVYHMAGLGTFSEYCVVSAKALAPLPDDMPLASASLIGCGVLTGFGAVVNTARVRVGETVAVVGCGGVGLNAVQGARIAGATQIIAVDPNDERLRLARSLGATLTFKPGPDLVPGVRAATDGHGVDVALEVAGRQESVHDAVRLARRGGRVILVGAAASDVSLNVQVYTGLVLTEKTIRGSLYGSAHVQIEVERLVALYRAGRLKLDELVTETFRFDQVNDAMAYCAAERGARAVMLF
ncbi:MAG: Zn-dependent alcohol dehydrogenase [Lautropia sp.]